MTPDSVLELAKSGIILTLWLSAPIVVAAAIVGLLFGFVQALTQVQDQTTQFAVKAIVVFGLLVLLGGWMGSQLSQYGHRVFDEIGVIR